MFPLLTLLFLNRGFVLGAGGPEAAPGPPVPATLQVNALSSLGRPLAGAGVFFYSTSPPSGETPSREPIKAETFSEGIYGKVLTSGSYRVEVVADGWQVEVLKDVELKPGEEKKLEVRLEPGSTVAGWVVDEDGRPLSGAKVTYRPQGGYGSLSYFSSSREERTDGNGRFDFRSLREGIYDIRVSMEGYAGRTLQDVATGTEDLKVILKKGMIIKGKLAGDTGKLNGNIRLELKKGGWRILSREVSLGEENSFVMTDLEDGAYDVRVKDGVYLSDWAKSIRTLPVWEGSPVTLFVYESAALSGKITDAATGQPLRGVKVALSPLGSKFSSSKTTDEDGNYRFRNVAEGRYKIEVRLAYDSTRDFRARKVLNIYPGQDLVGMDFELNPGRKVVFQGMVVDDEERPAAGAEIKLYCRLPPDKYFRSSFGSNAESDDAGYFTFSDFFDGEVEVKLSAKKEGYASTQCDTISLSPGQDSVDGIVLELDAGDSLRAEVVNTEDESIFRAKATLKKDRSADRESATSFKTVKKLTDVQGICRFEHLPAGQYRLEVKKSGYAEEQAKIKLEEGEGGKKVRVVLSKGRDLRVRVVNPAGEPVAGARVKAWVSDRFFSPLDDGIETDAAGYGNLENLPRKALFLQVEADGYPRLSRQNVAPDQSDIEVVLTDSGAIAGRIVGPGGEPVEGADIRVRLKKKTVFDFTSFFFSSKQLLQPGEGRFRVVDLKPGTYTVIVKAPGLAYRELKETPVKAGEETDLGEIELPAEGRISGRVIKAGDGSPLPQARISVKSPHPPSPVGSTRVDRTGRFEVENLPGGDYALVISAEGHRPREVTDLFISSGEVKELAAVELEELTEAEKEEIEREKNFIPSLGIRIQREEFPEHLSDLKIGEVEAGGAAAGLMPGDIIRRINGKTMMENPGVYMQGLLAKPGTKVKLSVIRKGRKEEEEVEVTIGDWDYRKMWEGD